MGYKNWFTLPHNRGLVTFYVLLLLLLLQSLPVVGQVVKTHFYYYTDDTVGSFEAIQELPGMNWKDNFRNTTTKGYGWIKFQLYDSLSNSVWVEVVILKNVAKSEAKNLVVDMGTKTTIRRDGKPMEAKRLALTSYLVAFKFIWFQ